jgi:small nuclear ribonucleoprotein (snRNP)-like protein
MVLLAAAPVVVAMASGARPKRRLHPSRVQVQNQGFEAPVRVAAYQFLRSKPGDVEGHRYKTWEDMQGQEVTVRVNDGTEVQGHISRIRFENMTGSDTKGQARRIRFEPMDTSGEDSGCQGKRIELKVGDAQAKLLRAATDRGESVYVRFSDEDDVRGHLYRVKF